MSRRFVNSLVLDLARCSYYTSVVSQGTSACVTKTFSLIVICSHVGVGRLIIAICFQHLHIKSISHVWLLISIISSLLQNGF